VDWLRNFVSEEVLAAIAGVLLLCQGAALPILLSRLIKGAVRRPPLTPNTATADRSPAGSVSIVVPTLNEVDRIAPCLQGLRLQGDVLGEILIVDSNSQDGTRELVKEAAEADSRLKLVTDDPLPAGWVGRPWALNYGFRASSPDSEWILGIDAD
jgi:dolichol-phosphate mannosyltransferase